MSKKLFRPLFVAMTLAVCAGAAVSAPLTLKVGDAAPEFKVATWLKGKPVPKLERGQVYLLEFWATRCAPCIAALPHLKALSEQYKGKVTFIAIGQPYDWETVDDVKQFVRKKGELMPYRVGMDTLHGKGPRMYDSWGPPAGFGGLPVTIVVDRTGKIAWTGMPTAVDEPLRQIVAGTYDLKAARKQQEIDHEAAEMDSELRESFRAALAAKEYASVIERVDSLAARNPEAENEVYAYKLMALLETDKRAAVEYAQFLPATLQSDAAAVLAEREDLTKPDYEFIAAQLEKAIADPETHVVTWQMLAQTYHRLGKLDRAIEVQKGALKKSEVMNYTEFSGMLREKLKEYEAEKARQR